MCKARRKLLCPRVQFSAKEVGKGPGREAGGQNHEPRNNAPPIMVGQCL